MTYLEIKKDDFYRVETTVDGRTFVTARGWDDLSQMISLYEQHGLTVDENLVVQYLQNKKIAKSFAVYYDLYNKYKADYKVDAILAGKVSPEIKQRAQSAKFDERLSLLGLLMDAVTTELRGVMEFEQVITQLQEILKDILGKITREENNPPDLLTQAIDEQNEIIQRAQKASALSIENQRSTNHVINILRNQHTLLLKNNGDNDSAIQILRADFNKQASKLSKDAKSAGKKLDNLFKFAADVFGEGQELLILVTELTINHYAARFISRFGSKEYFKYNKELMFYERQKDLVLEMERLELNEDTSQ
jgi:primosomal protein N'